MRWCGVLIAALLIGTASSSARATTRTLTFAGPPDGLLSLPVYRLMETGELSRHGIELRFAPWRNPDQLRAIVAGRQAEFVGLPTNVAANLANREIDVRLVAVPVWSALYVLARDGVTTGMAGLRGKTVAVPFRGDLPEIVFLEAASLAGLKPEVDFKVRFAPSSLDAVHLLMDRQVDAAVVAEPVASMAVHKSRGQEGGELRRAVDLQAALCGPDSSRPELPLGGLAVVGRPEGIAEFSAAYSGAIDWCRANPEAAGHVLNSHFPSVPADAATDAVRSASWRFATATSARRDLESLFGRLLARNPPLIGGRLPAGSFYFSQPGDGASTASEPSHVSSPDTNAAAAR